MTVVRRDADQRRIALRLNRVLGQSAGAGPVPILVTPGWQGTGRVVKVVPEADGRGGYILLQLAEGTRPAMLLAKNMTADRRFDLNAGNVDVDEEIDVEVLSVDRARGRVMLRDFPKADTEPVEFAPAA